MSEKNIILKQFNIEDLQLNDPLHIGIIGKIKTGKSNLLKDILCSHKNILIDLVISASEQYKPFYETFLPQSIVHREYNSSIIKTFIEKQNDQQNAVKYVILDDCLSNELTYHSPLRPFIFNARHLKTGLFTVICSPSIIPIDYSRNVDYVFIFKYTNTQDLTILYENYISDFLDFESFYLIMDKIHSESYECIVVDKTKKTKNVEDCIFLYRAKHFLV